MNGLTAVPGIRVGHVSDLEGLTGCTVVQNAIRPEARRDIVLSNGRAESFNPLESST